MTTVLIAVTDAQQRGAFGEALRTEGFTTVMAGPDRTPRRILETTAVDIVILDRSPYGLDLLRQLHGRHELRIIAMCSEEGDRVRALESGADHVGGAGAELIAQLHALERRIKPRGVIAAGDVVVDVDRQSVIVRGESIPVPEMEFAILLFLASQPRQVFTHRTIYEEVFHAPMVREKLTTVVEHVYRLRRRIEDNPREPRHLVTVRGRGYRFDP